MLIQFIFFLENGSDSIGRLQFWCLDIGFNFIFAIIANREKVSPASTFFGNDFFSPADISFSG